MILSLIALMLFVLYIGAAIANFGIPKSISNTYYLYEEKAKGLGYLFTAFLWIEAFLIVSIMIDMGEDSPWQFVGFLCPTGLAFCGAAVLSEDKGTLEGHVHYFGAYLGAIAGVVWCCIFIGTKFTLLELLCMSVVCFGISAIPTKTLRSSFTFWLELAVFGTIIWCIIANAAALWR
ncbi:MAG: hypothetical protein K6G73_12550 [Marinilabiliaceae bacterium]|nr:hypothetical protein [Marinilabiliaceae bacterium]